MGSFVPVLRLNQVGSIRKGRYGFVAITAAGASTGVVEVEMGEGNDVYVFHSEALGLELAYESTSLHHVHAFIARSVLVADAGVYQDDLAIGPDEEAVKADGHPVPSIGTSPVIPDDLGDKTIESSAVDSDGPIADEG